MPYCLCDCLEYKPSYGFHIVVLAFLTGILAAHIMNYIMTLDEKKLLYLVTFLTSILWIVVTINNSDNSFPDGMKTEL